MSKGIESLPFSILISVFIMTVVIGCGFYIFYTVTNLNSVSGFVSGISDLQAKIEFLKSGDIGSFSSVKISVPKNYFMSFKGSSIVFGNSSYSSSVPVNAVFSEFRMFEPGIYNILLCHGKCYENNAVVFE